MSCPLSFNTSRLLVLLCLLVGVGVGSIYAEAPRTEEKPKHLTPQVTMATTLELRQKKSDAAAIAYLGEKMRERAGNYGNFRNLFSYTWREAQVRSGRVDGAWASRLNDVAFTVAYEERYYKEASEIISNLCTTLSRSGRFGRFAEVMAIWEEAQRLSGHRMDLDSYPDLGPAISCLPEVRHRQMPATLPSPKEVAGGLPPRNRPNRFHIIEAGAFANFGHLNYNAGRWREGIEWLVWVRDWATSKKTGQPVGEYAHQWFGVTESISLIQVNMGFYKEALVMTDEAIAAPHGQTYLGCSRITLGILRLNILRYLDQAPDDIVDRLGEFVVRAKTNRHVSEAGHKSAKVSLAKALLHTGRTGEAEALLDTLVAEGSQYARSVRVRHWLDSGRVEGVEQELVDLLKLHRKNGHKLSECSLYSNYADFLQARGRDSEALMMRREVVRLSRAFDLFYRLPVDLAKLASLLHRLGDEAGSATVAKEARILLAKGRVAPSRAKEANKHLGDLSHRSVVKTPARAPEIDLQPQRSVVIPLTNVPWTSYLSLANPGDQSQAGRLHVSGPPVSLAMDDDSGDIFATLLAATEAGDKELPLTIGPGTYYVIHIRGSAKTDKEAELRFSWSQQNSDPATVATVSIEAPESGVTGAIIQAGGYRTNPFYGVPMHLHYVTKIDSPASPPLRFVCSQKTRVEVYLLDGTPLAIDGQGNGSLLDQGDQLFTSSDGKGNPLLPLVEGAAGLSVVLYPDGPLPEEGLTLDIEIFEDGNWQLYSSNRLDP